MKLRNKKTGEIGTLLRCEWNDSTKSREIAVEVLNSARWYKSLAELNEEWEDYHEEPKWYWYIDEDGVIQIDQVLSSEINMRKSIGNYFETKEEAEKAVEKLKAYKRLKDKGFKFIGVRGIGKVIDFDIPKPYHQVAFDEFNANEDELEFYNDLMLLFGGEE